MNRTKLIADVRHILDEQELVQDPALAYTAVDSLDIGGRVDAVFCSAFDTFAYVAPLRMLTESEMPMSGLVYDSGKGTGYLPLPADYLRLGRFKMKGWKREVHTPIADEGDDYQLQLCGATRGGTKNPVVAICLDEGRLEYYSLPRGVQPHEIEVATYVKKASTIAESELKEIGYEAFIWWLAREVGTTFKADVSGITNKIKEIFG